MSALERKMIDKKLLLERLSELSACFEQRDDDGFNLLFSLDVVSKLNHLYISLEAANSPLGVGQLLDTEFLEIICSFGSFPFDVTTDSDDSLEEVNAILSALADIIGTSPTMVQSEVLGRMVYVVNAIQEKIEAIRNCSR